MEKSILLKLYSILTKYRSIIGYEKKSYSTNSSIGLPGNLAICTVFNKNKIFELHEAKYILSPSYKAVDATFLKKNKDVLIATLSGAREGLCCNSDTPILLYKNSINIDEVTPYYLAKEGREMDSERVIVNVLQYMENYRLISNSKLKTNFEDNYNVIILTERIPCSSCFQVLIEFLRHNIDIKMYLFYLYETDCSDNNEPRDFITLSQELGYEAERERLFINKISPLKQGGLSIGEQVHYAANGKRFSNYKDVDRIRELPSGFILSDEYSQLINLLNER